MLFVVCVPVFCPTSDPRLIGVFEVVKFVKEKAEYHEGIFGIIFFLGEGILGEGVLDYCFFFWERGCFVWDFFGIVFFLGEGMFCLGILISERVKDWGRWSVFQVRKEGEGDLKLCWLPTKLTGGCDWRGYEREEKEGEREVDNLSTCGCVIQLYLWENT